MSAETIEMKIASIVCGFAYSVKPSPELVRDILCNITGIEKYEFLRKKRYRHLVAARQVSMWYFVRNKRKGTHLNTLSSIGEAHGGKDHATVIYATKTINSYLSIGDEMITEMVTKLQKQLLSINPNFAI